MKRLFSSLLFFFAFANTILALDNEAWLAKARSLVEEGFMMDSDETEEDGFYCLMLTEITSSSMTSANEALDVAVLEGKRKITAFVKGETVSAAAALEMTSETISNNDEKTRISYHKYEKKIQSQVNALVKCIKVIGQVTKQEHAYLVCLTCEKYEDQMASLQKAQAEYGIEGVVSSTGEAASRELAIHKAIRGAVEQVLGTVVVGYDKMRTDSSFQREIFSGTNGVVETYRILSETETTLGKRIEIVAKVSKKNLLDNYSNYMKFLDNPAFFIQTDSPDLATFFNDFFIEMGIRITPKPEEAMYIIVCSSIYHEVKHPIEADKFGVQLSLRFSVLDAFGKEILIDMKNDPRKATCFVGSDFEKQKEICARKAFKQMQNPLHRRIQMMIGTLVGRKMEAASSSVYEE